MANQRLSNLIPILERLPEKIDAKTFFAIGNGNLLQEHFDRLAVVENGKEFIYRSDLVKKVKDQMKPFDVFVSHTWAKDSLNRDNHQRVLRLAAALKQRGLQVWIDEEQIKGDVTEAMADGIDGSHSCLCCMSKGCKESANFRLEAQYAKKKLPGKLVFVGMDPLMSDINNLDGWLGLMAGAFLILTCSSDEGFEAAVDHIAENIRTVSTIQDSVIQALLTALFDTPSAFQPQTANGSTSANASANSNAKSTALNDSAKGGIDRLGYGSYAAAMFKVLNGATPPVCVGLYAKWGSGKSFMIHLLKKQFDKYVREEPKTHELKQWFEEGYEALPKSAEVFMEEKTPLQAKNKKAMSTTCLHRIYNRFKVIGYVFQKATQHIWNYYVVLTLLVLIQDMLDDFQSFVVQIWRQLYGVLCACYRGDDLMSDSADDEEFSNLLGGPGKDLEANSNKTGCISCSGCYPTIHPTSDFAAPTDGKDNGASSSNKETTTEYILVDFNAWEFSRSDELWAGLIRSIYQKVELRLQHNRVSSDKKKKPSIDMKRKFNSVLHHAKDWKLRWRVQKAIAALLKQYGGVAALRVRLLLLLSMACGVAATIILSALGIVDLWQAVKFSSKQIFATIASVVGFLIAFIPSVKLLYSTNKESGVSQGDLIFAEANRVQDQLGFLNKVRMELDELFRFMHEYEQQTNIELRLVLFVDDLDRCLEGRNVKVLEAIQLVLAISGAPVVAFLAIDSRVVVASIEATINKSLSLHDALISGWEYLDKIVQLSFCLPEASVEKIQRLMSASMQKPVTPAIVKDFVMQKLQSINKELAQAKKYRSEVSIQFKEDLQYYQKHQTDEAPAKEWHIMELREIMNIDYGMDAIDVVIALAGKVNYASKEALLLINHAAAEGLEIACRMVMKAFLELQLIDKEDPLLGLNTATHNVDLIDEGALADPENGSIDVNKTVEEKKVSKWLWQSTEENDALDPLLTNEMQYVANMCCTRIDSNPRRLKRILNVLQLISELAKLKPVDESLASGATAATTTAPPKLMVLRDLPSWKLFSMKLCKWIFLCESFPFRISFLMHFMIDLEQKRNFNIFASREHSLIPYRYASEHIGRAAEERVGSVDEGNASSEQMQDAEKYSVSQFYIEFVEKYIYVIKSSERLLLLDGDPEEFTTMLFQPLLAPPGEEMSPSDLMITCVDVLGPVIGKNPDGTMLRDRTISLLAYSFNLNPSMRRQISTEIEEVTTDWELMNGNKSILRKGSVIRKQGHIMSESK